MGFVIESAKYVLLVLILHSFCTGWVAAKSKYNVSMGQLGTCKEYDLRGTGYMYNEFFHIQTMENNKIKDNERLHLKFYVMTAMDAHILLSPIDRPRIMDRVYEIVIGAGGNTFSAIRTNMGRRRVATNHDLHLLSIFDPTPIEIVQTKEGELKVFIPGFKEEPLLNYTDPAPIDIHYLSFSTFGMITARWFYDCQFDGFDAEIEQEQRPQTPLQKLVSHLTSNVSDSQLMPTTLEGVDFGFQIRSVAFKQKSQVLTTRLDLVLSWEDPRLQWNPLDFNNITIVVQKDLDIWKPDLVVLNGALESVQHLRPGYEMRITANGSVSVLANDVEVMTWCLNEASNWPHELLSCEIVLAIDEFAASALGQLELNFNSEYPLSSETVNSVSEWKFIQIFVRHVENASYERYTEGGVRQVMDGDTVIGFTIIRNGGFYRNVFTMPVVASQMLLLLSFLLRGYRRGGLLLVAFVVLVLGLMFISRHAPPSYQPRILVAYQWYLVLSVVCYVLHILILWLELYPPSQKPNSLLMSVVNCSPLRLLLCMRYQDAKEYIDIQEHPWHEVAKLLNNALFLFSGALFVVLDTCLLPRA